jgi:hypothetical protein
MASLLETLQKRLAAPARKPVEQEINIEEVLKAKKGKGAAPSRGVAASQIGVGIARDIGEQALETQQQAGQLAAEGIAQQQAQVAEQAALGQEELASQQRIVEASLAAQGLKARTGLIGSEELAGQQRAAAAGTQLASMNNKATSALQSIAADKGITMNNIFSDVKTSDKELAFREDAADLEQKATLLALQDRSYLDELQRIGQARRLDDSIAFSEELTQTMYDNDMLDFMNSINFRAGQDMKERNLKDQLAKLGNDQIIQMADLAAQAKNQEALYTGVGQVITTGLDIAAKKKEG